MPWESAHPLFPGISMEGAIAECQLGTGVPIGGGRSSEFFHPPPDGLGGDQREGVLVVVGPFLSPWNSLPRRIAHSVFCTPFSCVAMCVPCLFSVWVGGVFPLPLVHLFLL